MRWLKPALLLPLVLLSGVGICQKGKILDSPEIWSPASYDYATGNFYDQDGKPQNEEYWKFPGGHVKKNDKWRVFVDHEGTQMFDKANGAAKKQLAFGTQYYVYAESKDWLELGSETGPEGWCNKADLILWNQALVDPLTRIELKAFIVNTLQVGKELRAIDKEKYQVYDGPGAQAKVTATPLIYDVLFVYKFEKKDGTERYLVSAHQALGTGSPLLGWVNKDRVKIWNTRLCLEPNFNPDAIAERRSKNIMVKLFQQGDNTGLQNYLLTGQGKGMVDGGARDPAFGKDPERKPRMSGMLFRYPVLGANRAGLGANNCAFLTGFSGRPTLSSSNLLEGFDDDDFTMALTAYEAYKDRRKNVNLIFVVEGSAGMKDHLAMIKKCVADINQKYKQSNTIQYGAIVYRNEHALQSASADPVSNYLDHFPLSNDAAALLSWLDREQTIDAGDRSQSRAVYFALKEALKEFPEYETNILIHLGRRPDNGKLNGWYAGKTKVDPSELGDFMSMKKAVDYFGYVTPPDGTMGPQLQADAYEGMQTDVMQNLANALSQNLKGLIHFAKDTGQVQAPVAVRMTEGNGLKVTRISKSSFLFKAYLVKGPEQFKAIPQSIDANVDSCIAINNAMIDDLGSIVEDKSALKDRAADFTFDVGSLMQFGDADKQRMRDYLFREKVHVFVDANTYYSVSDLKYPLFRYVLFYPDEKLRTDINDIKDLLRTMDNLDPAVVSVGLRDYWRTKAERVLGTKYDPNKITTTELNARLMGIQHMDMVKPFENTSVLKGLSLKDLENSKKLSPALMANYKAALTESLKKLEDLQSQADFYQVPGDVNRKYFWVPIEYLFN